MRAIKKYFIKKKYIILFIGILFIIGIISGLLFSIPNISFLKEHVNYYTINIQNQSYNYLLIHFFLLVVGFSLSFIGFGIPLICTMIFYEGLTYGFLIGMFTSIYGISGFLFSGIFFLITKGIFIFLLSIFFLKCVEIMRKMFGKFIYKTNPFPDIFPYIKSCGYILLLTILIDIFIIILGNKIISIFHFLIS